MKINPGLHNKIGFQNPGQKAWYAAHILMSALTNSPAIKVRDAVTAVVGKRAITAYAGFTAVPAKTSAQNTTGYAAGIIFPGRSAIPAQAASDGYAAVAAIPALAPSPAYAIGVAVPAYPAVPARAAQLEVLPVAAVTAVSSPAVIAIKGWGDAIQINQSSTALTIIADLPVAAGVGIVGSNKLVIGEITPTALQATDYIDTPASFISGSEGASNETLEQYFYRNALLCDNCTVTDVIKVVDGVSYNCKHVELILVPLSGFDASSDSFQLNKVSDVVASTQPTFVHGQVIATQQLNPTGKNWFVWTNQAAVIAGQNATNLVAANSMLFAGMIIDSKAHIENIEAASDAAWLTFVNTTAVGSVERDFKTFVQSLPQPVYFTSNDFQATLPAPDYTREGKTYLDRNGEGWRYYPV